MQQKNAYTFLFNIENSLGKLTVFKMIGEIEEYVNHRVEDQIITECRVDSIPEKVSAYKYVIHFFRHICFPIKMAYENVKDLQNPIFTFEELDKKLNLDETNDLAKQYIENDRHINQLVLDKKVQLQKGEWQFEFLYRLIQFKNTVFNQEAYEVLIRCADAGDFVKWDKFRSTNEGRKLFLNGAKLNSLNLSGVDFGSVHFKGAQISGTSFKTANLVNVHFEDAEILESDFSQADMSHSFLKSASFTFVNLSGTNLLYSRVDSKTSFILCDISKKTDMELANWEAAIYDPGLKQLVEKINRKKNWEQWYNVHSILKYPVNFFWWLTDYGTSITRLILLFFGASIFFALLYHSIPGVVDGLQEYSEHPDLKFLRAFYFSIVTMTTLGFGDIHAAKDVLNSTIGIIALGHILLIAQVLLGYFILGTLVTFLGILFKAPGPIQPYSDVLSPKKRLNYEIKKQSNWESKRKIDYWESKKKSSSTRQSNRGMK